MLVDAIVLQEAKDSSEIENIITTQDELYKAIAIDKSNISAATKEVVNYRKAIFLGFDLVERQGFLSVNDRLKHSIQAYDKSGMLRTRWTN